MINGPLVSVIIPTYNRRDKIAVAIDSVLKQTYKNIQLIVSDDGSMDGTEEFIKERYPNIDYVLSEHGGQSSARNKGLSLSKASIIASLDSDDQWAPDFLETCVTKLEEDQLDFVFTNWIQELKDGSKRDFLSGDLFLKPFTKNKKDNWKSLTAIELRSLYLKACPSPSSSAVMRKSSIVSGWNEKINISDDWFLFLEMILSKPCSAAFTMEVHWNKFINSNNVYDGRSRSELLELFHIQDTLEFMSRFKGILSEAEYKVLNKRCVRGFVELAKHNVFKELDFHQSAKLIRDSVRLGVRETLIAIPDVVFFGLNRHLRGLIDRVRKLPHALLW